MSRDKSDLIASRFRLDFTSADRQTGHNGILGDRAPEIDSFASTPRAQNVEFCAVAFSSNVHFGWTARLDGNAIV